MAAPKTFWSTDQLQKAKEKGRSDALNQLKREFSSLCSESLVRDRIFSRIIKRTEDFCRYRVDYIGKGYWQITLVVLRREREVRKRAEKLQPHNRHKIRIKVIRKGKNGN